MHVSAQPPVMQADCIAGRPLGDEGQSPPKDATAESGQQEPSSVLPDFTWGDVDGGTLVNLVTRSYNEVVHWQRNLFNVPSGSTGKDFIRELTRLIDGFSQRSTFEGIALCAAMLMPHLLLQKPHAKSKAKEHVTILERRLTAWRQGRIAELLHEGRALQYHLKARGEIKVDDNVARSFAKRVHQGRIRSALRLLDKVNARGGVLPLDKTLPDTGKNVRQILKEKHPEANIPPCEVLLPLTEEQNTNYHPVIYQQITAGAIRSAVLRVEGGAGPSGIDAQGWRRLCTSFGVVSDDLCRALADFTRRILSEPIPVEHLEAYVACRLVPLDKSPGVRPIGICEVMRRIVGKAALKVIGPYIQQAAGTAQLCAGQPMGIEAAIHATRNIFDDKATEAILMVDASNAFNRLNRKAAQHNISQLCPALSTIINNTYSRPARLFVGGETLLSEEGTTQGDPLAMSMYAVATLPLIKELGQCAKTKQIWFADDASDAGELNMIKTWWNHLTTHGPGYGYYPNATKTWLLVKEPFEEKARQLFGKTGVNITTEGRRLLGAALGSGQFVSDYVSALVTSLVDRVAALAEIARSQPHAALTAFNRGLSSEWTFLSRTVAGVSPLMQPLEKTIRQVFLPALTGRHAPNDDERDLLALPIRLGGMGLADPSRSTATHYQGSVRAAEPLSKLIEDQVNEMGDACVEVRKRRSVERLQRTQLQINDRKAILPRLSADAQRALDLAAEKGASSWLTVMPLERYGFVLHKGEFRDALCLRYNWPPPLLPATCVCGKNFDTGHAMSCPTGGYPTLRHNELRDITARLMKEVTYDVTTEPVLQPITTEQLSGRCANREDGARLDIAARGFWGCGAQRAFFDVRVFNPSAPTHRDTQPSTLYQRNEREKRRQYQERVCEVERGSFTPLVFATTGGMGSNASTTYKRLASLLATKRKESYSLTMALIRAQLSFALLRSAVLCLRGSRSRKSASCQLNTLPPMDLVASEVGLNT